MFYKLSSFAILSLTVFVFSTSNISFAQASYLDSLDGKFALQFQLDYNFKLTNFQGSTFSGKYNYSDRDVVRMGISIGISKSDSDNNIIVMDSTRRYILEKDDKRSDIAFAVQYIRHITGSSDISFFAGIGPSVGFYSNDYSYVRFVNEEEIPIQNEYDHYHLGLNIIFGVEWMFYKFMTLSAEYGINAYYFRSNRKDIEGESIIESEKNGYNVQYNQVRFGLSVYF